MTDKTPKVSAIGGSSGLTEPTRLPGTLPPEISDVTPAIDALIAVANSSALSLRLVSELAKASANELEAAAAALAEKLKFTCKPAASVLEAVRDPADEEKLNCTCDNCESGGPAVVYVTGGHGEFSVMCSACDTTTHVKSSRTEAVSAWNDIYAIAVDETADSAWNCPKGHGPALATDGETYHQCEDCNIWYWAPEGRESAGMPIWGVPDLHRGRARAFDAICVKCGEMINKPAPGVGCWSCGDPSLSPPAEVTR